MDEQFKQPLMIGAIAGGLTVIAVQLGFNYSGTNSFMWIAAIGGGLLAAGIGFGVAYAVTRNQ